MRPTREGKRLILTALLIVLTALNTGNNLIYIMLGVLLSVITVSVLMLWIDLRRLAVSALARGAVYAGEDAVVDVSITNAKRMVPSFSIEVSAPDIAEGKATAIRIGPRSASVLPVTMKFLGRGAHPLTALILSSSFPFIFFSGRASARAEGSITVYPRLLDMPDSPLAEGRGSSRSQFRKGEGDDLHGLREFRYGDDVRRVSWKSSAKTEKLMLREFAEDSHDALTIILDDIGPAEPEAFERAVSVAATLAVRHSQAGRPVGLATCGGLISASPGAENLYRILDALAVVSEFTGRRCGIDAEHLHGVKVGVLKRTVSNLGGLAGHCEVLIDASVI